MGRGPLGSMPTGIILHSPPLGSSVVLHERGTCRLSSSALAVLGRLPTRTRGGDGAPGVPRIGHKLGAPSSSLGSSPAVASVTLVPLLGRDDSHPRGGSKRLLAGSLL
ncbi:hypothetical protein NDU88_005047 [Pleurodeles waltl]|uniref:Uncharacterized protein n=1 Tax=Pleurodeles waltl TaxID=8319 RepID=A0AAV7TVG9_PLEWA|nr:hypothetical protein NDU88_005047 [Pleurodeles waltl]